MRFLLNKARGTRLPYLCYIAVTALFITFGCIGCEQQNTEGGSTVSAVQFGGVYYLARVTGQNGYGRVLQKSDLGPIFGYVKFNTRDVSEDPSAWKDGDATDLDVGTPIYSVQGYKTTFRLAAFSHGKLTLYEADSALRAQKGGDLLDLKDKVIAIDIFDWVNTNKQLASITSLDTINNLVQMIQGAPVKQNFSTASNAATKGYMLVFLMKDGTAVYRTYFPTTHELVHYIILPESFDKITSGFLK